MSHVATWLIAAGALIGVITRPKNWPEAWWAVSGALALVAFSLISPTAALGAVAKGSDVYLFLIGMMILAELARREGLFDWLAAYALLHARGSGQRLFLLIYAVGTLVTVVLSNDATAVVLTPAVYAAARHAKTAPLPYLLICAFIANAASFVLPISNPANLVLFGDNMPPLRAWLGEFAAASAVSILLTYLLLRLSQRASIALAIAPAGALKRTSPWPILGKISWSVVPLVAGLFVLVQALDGTEAFVSLIRVAAWYAQQAPAMTALMGGGLAALASNLTNNLPMGLIGATVAQGAGLSAHLTGALLIGVDLGPNLSITGSLATVLWLVAIRREGVQVSAREFLRVGSLVMPPALLATLAVFVCQGVH
jgi:arsenical pump membrane protein